VHRPRPQADGGRSQGSVSRAGRSLNKTAFDASLGPPGLRQGAALEHLEGDGEAIYRHACLLGLEGIMSKRPGTACGAYHPAAPRFGVQKDALRGKIILPACSASGDENRRPLTAVPPPGGGSRLERP
jgi:hypothetical protein